MQEGCLSVPGYYDDVERAETIRYSYLDQEGESIEEEADGLMSVCVQHEIDHLDGMLFLDRLVSRRNDLFKRKVYKE